MSSFSTVGMCVGAVGVNTVYTIQHHHDPFPTILAGALFTGVCVVAGGFRPEIGTALAALFLLSSLLTRGTAFINWLTALQAGATKKKVASHG